MRRLCGTRQTLRGAIIVSLLIGPQFAVAQEQIASSVGCVLRSMAVDQEDHKAQLVLHTEGPPASLGTRIEPNAVIVLDLAGCSPAPELTEQSFNRGLVAGLRLAKGASNIAVIVETRHPFEYSVSSKQDRVDVTLKAAADRPELVRVLEPLPVPDGSQPTAGGQGSNPVEQPVLAQDPVTPVEPLAPASIPETAAEPPAETAPATAPAALPVAPPQPPKAADRIVTGARLSITQAPRYDPSYTAIAYPNGDPGWHRGSGVDLIIRAYRQLGIDLQKAIHEDIVAAPEAYGVRRPDTNIDHRRVRNLQTFLERHGQTLPTNAQWQAGDIVFWTRDDPRKRHVGIISDRTGSAGQPLVIHHSPDTVPTEDDVLTVWPITGHNRWLPDAQ
ncbi:MAG: DUF1287 domain-containing protein [Acidobacteriota bacterium]